MSKEKVKTIVINKTSKKSYRDGTARDAWHKRLLEFDGKPLADFEASCTASEPSTPKKSTTYNAVAGWLGFYKREGVCKVVEK